MISPERAVQILREEGCSSEVIRHTLAVTEKSVEVAQKISDNGHEVDLELVEVGSLLHDVGRSRTHGISHGVKGGQILRERGLDELVGFAENHLGAGITSGEAEGLDIPTKDYLPSSLEEKIVTYSDNLLKSYEVVSYQEALNELEEELGPEHPGAQRFKKLHEEIKRLQGTER